MCPTRITVIRKLGSEKCIATRNLPLTSLTLKEPATRDDDDQVRMQVESWTNFMADYAAIKLYKTSPAQTKRP